MFEHSLEIVLSFSFRYNISVKPPKEGARGYVIVKFRIEPPLKVLAAILRSPAKWGSDVRALTP